MVRTILFCYGIVVALITIAICLEMFCLAYDCADILGESHNLVNKIMMISCLIWGSWLIIVLYDELLKTIYIRTTYCPRRHVSSIEEEQYYDMV